MESFNYVVFTQDGKEKKGSIEAETEESARAMLREKGNTVISVNGQTALNSNVSLTFMEKKPTSRDMSVFCRQFVSIVDAGVPVLSALAMLGEQTENPMLKSAIVGCRQQIEKGSSFADAMTKYPKVFNHIFVTMTRAGESSGSLSNSFKRMGEQFEKQHKLENLVKKAMIYPIVLVVVTIIVVIVLLVKVVPTFKDVLSSLDTKLPAITKFVLGYSKNIQTYWYIHAAVIGGIVVLILRLKNGNSSAGAFAKFQVKMPVFGKLTIKEHSASFSRTLSTLLGAGIPMIDALTITAGTMKNKLFKDAVLGAKDAVSMGSNLSSPIKSSGQFPPLVYHMIGIGEDTGNIDGMLTKLADYYDEEVEETTQQIMALLEPLIIIILALVVGTIVLAVISPMAAMYQGLDKL